MLGEEVASEEALERRVLEQLQGRGRWGGRDDYTPADGVVHAIRSSPDAGAWFETALLTALDSDDVGVRAGAISALGALRAPSAPALLDALRRSPDRFVDVPFPPERRQSRSLEDALAGLIARAVQPDELLSVYWLQHRARTRGCVNALLALARVTPDWVLTHAKPGAHRGLVIGLLRNLARREDRAALIAALGPWSDEDAARVLGEPAWGLIPISDEERGELARALQGEP